MLFGKVQVLSWQYQQISSSQYSLVPFNWAPSASIDIEDLEAVACYLIYSNVCPLQRDVGAHANYTRL